MTYPVICDVLVKSVAANCALVAALRNVMVATAVPRYAAAPIEDAILKAATVLALLFDPLGLNGSPVTLTTPVLLPLLVRTTFHSKYTLLPIKAYVALWVP